ncbi:FAD-dependent monooxygenase [Burkholderia gladioli]|uniref:FAD-monooxygenase n=1 Tax=Burkholderia gladioli TaxID=28095 RepID=A0A2A7S9R2_BURGA|nr:FAD-monooxygenase [Burkholderia gladioli pv. gladioli]AWY56887.1 FAD-monooxygenase [Burkholderia gladioli pv. gladioli]PEH40212.1 FAD-monooxygenase [Burkholderia gladioli]QPQ85332.1 FAD-dependent monooxygenase [Burkholderia gladioli]
MGKPRVLIVGAGPAGLAMAIELGHRGIPCLLVERNDRVGYAPRAKTTNVRTREHLRRWGIADRLRAASPLGVDYPSNVVFCTRLAGFELARHENAMFCAPGRNPLYSEHAQWIPQYTVEDVLRSHAQSLPGVEIRFRCELREFVQDDEVVTAILHDLDQQRDVVVDVDYLVGTDGARSLVRNIIGTRMEGQYGLSKNYNIVFRAPGLADAHGLGPAIMYWQINRDAPSLIGPMDVGDTWFFMPTHVSSGAPIEGADARAMIATATGIDLPYEVLSSDEWVASKLLGDRYRKGRAFLAGDACHLHPPFGGYGMNMGVADSVDLGWKLAAVLQGWGGPALLDSYEAERRPVHQWVLDEAVVNHATLGNQLVMDDIEADCERGESVRREIGSRITAAKMREFSTLGVVLGYRYDDSPIVIPDGSASPEKDFINYVASSRPGALAPHAWLHDGSSLYDHFGSGFTLLASTRASKEEVASVVSDATDCGLPLKVIQPPEGGIANLYPARFTLIRPDQHVAWRGDAQPAMATIRTVAGFAAD